MKKNAFKTYSGRIQRNPQINKKITNNPIEEWSRDISEETKTDTHMILNLICNELNAKSYHEDVTLQLTWRK